MRKLTLIAAVAFAAMLFTSCGKHDYDEFVGTWGAEKVEYYNIDYAGNPIAASMQTYTYDPEDEDNSIRLTFRADNTGEMRDSAIDTLYTNYDEEHEIYLDTIPCSDTVMIYNFTCSFDKFNQCMYMNIVGEARPYRIDIVNMDKNTFVYVNEYGNDYVEKAYMKRITGKVTKSGSSKPVRHPHNKPGSLFGSR
jgi:hypothetical protein